MRGQKEVKGEKRKIKICREEHLRHGVEVSFIFPRYNFSILGCDKLRLYKTALFFPQKIFGLSGRIDKAIDVKAPTRLKIFLNPLSISINNIVLYTWIRKRGEKMTPKGRPTDDPKILNTRVRLSRDDIQRLEYCAQVTGMKKSEIIRQGIKEVYERLKK